MFMFFCWNDFSTDKLLQKQKMDGVNSYIAGACLKGQFSQN